MVASLGALYQEFLTGQGPYEQILEGKCPPPPLSSLSSHSSHPPTQLNTGHLNPFGDGQGFF